MTTRIIISKSTKKKMSSKVEQLRENEHGKLAPYFSYRTKADGYTQQVVTKTKLSNGKIISTTTHEKIY